MAFGRLPGTRRMVPLGPGEGSNTRVADADGGGGGTPAWLPSGAVAFADFVGGHYYANGAETTAAATVSDPSQIDGSGLTPTTAPAIIGDVAAAMLASAATIVLDVLVPADNAPLLVVANSADDTHELYYVGVGGPPDIVGIGGYDSSAGIDVSSAVVMTGTGDKIAFTFDGSKFSISVDGEAVVTNTGSIAPTATHVLVGGYTAGDAVTSGYSIRSITIYAPKLDAALPALSAL